MSGSADDRRGGRPPLDEQNPWPGLSEFREDENRYFRGRESETGALFDLVGRSRLTVLFGKSGLGKTSLLRAGLFPKLWQDDFFPVYVRLDFTDGTPLRGQVLQAVAEQAAQGGVELPPPPDGGQPVTLWEYLHRRQAEFWSRANRLVAPVLVFDQFEEVFTLGRLAERADDRRSFLGELAELAEGRAPAAVRERLRADPRSAKAFDFNRHDYRLVLSLREDYLAELEGLSGLMRSVFSNRYRLERMNGRSALQVVAAPAHLIDREVAEEVVRFVAAQKDERAPLAELGVEPALLSVVCRELNEGRKRRQEQKITAGLLGVDSREIIARFYDSSLADSPVELRHFVEDQLLTVQGHRNIVALDNALAVPGISQADLDHLVDRRLLRKEERAGVWRVELTHDLLIEPIRDSRDLRHEREERDRAEARLREEQQLRREERQRAEARIREEEERRQQAQAAAARNFRRSLLAAGLAVAALAALLWALSQKRQADHARMEAQRHEQVSIAQAMAARGVKEVGNHGDVELAALLAKSAYDQVVENEAWPHLAPIDEALRAVLAYPNFSQILRADNRVNSVAASADGMVVAAGGYGLQIRVWNLGSLHRAPRALRLPGAERAASFREAAAVALSPDGRWLAAAGRIGRRPAQVWDLHGPDSEPMVLGEEKAVGVAFSPAGRYLATGERRGKIGVWAVEALPDGARPIFEGLLGGSGSLNVLAFSRDESLIAAGGSRGVGVWRVEGGEDPICRIYRRRYPRTLSFSPDGSTLAVAAVGGSYLYPIGPGCEVEGRSLPAETRYAAVYAPDGRLALADSDGIGLWDPAASRELGRLQGHGAAPRSVVFANDGRRLISGSTDLTVRVWELDRGAAEPRILRPPTEPTEPAPGGDEPEEEDEGAESDPEPDAERREPVTELAFHPRQPVLAAGGLGGSLRLWDLVSGASQAIEVEWRVGGLAFHPQGGEIAWIGGRNRRIRISPFPLTAEESEAGVPLPVRSRATALAYDRNGSLVIATGSTVRIFERAGQEPAEGPKIGRLIRGLAFSPDSSWLAVVGSEARALVGEGGRGEVVDLGSSRGITSNAVAWSRDGDRIATGGAVGDLRLWDPDRPAAPLVRLGGHRGAVLAVDFSPTDDILASAGADGTVRLWDFSHLGHEHAESEDRVEPFELTGHDGAVLAVGFGTDGRQVASAGEDGTVRLWTVSTEELARQICSRVYRNLSRAEWDRLVSPKLPYRCTCAGLPPGPGVGGVCP